MPQDRATVPIRGHVSIAFMAPLLVYPRNDSTDLDGLSCKFQPSVARYQLGELREGFPGSPRHNILYSGAE
jgi:hypothetical protein